MKQLILTGDDFGLNSAVNEAIERQHQEGLLTQASLMVNEPGVDEAVRIARRNPKLCVGLHLTLCAGRAAAVSSITDPRGDFHPSPALAGLRYAFDPQTHRPLRREIDAQVQRFAALGFRPAYLDGHAHLHLHPTVLRLTRSHFGTDGFQCVRLVREPGNHSPVALIFRALSGAAARKLRTSFVRAADHVFGLRDTGRMSTARMVHLLDHLPDGLSEIYFHPGAEPADFDITTLREQIVAHRIVVTSAEQEFQTTK